MKKQYKYALAGLSFAASTATSIYFGVKGFYTEPPFQRTAYQQQEGEDKQFIRGGVDDHEWQLKSEAFTKEISDENDIRRNFKGTDLSKYSSLISNYKKTDNDSKKKIKEFLYLWCYYNRASKNKEIFHLIGSYCVRGNESRARP